MGKKMEVRKYQAAFSYLHLLANLHMRGSDGVETVKFRAGGDCLFQGGECESAVSLLVAVLERARRELVYDLTEVPPSTRRNLRTYYLSLISNPGIGQVFDVSLALV